MTIHSPLDAKRLGIATVYQDLALCDNLDVVANLYLGEETIETGPQARAARDRRDRRWSSARSSCSTRCR